MRIKKLLVLTSGGDAPGMNAALRAVVRSATHAGIHVFGSEMGYQGLIDRKVFELKPRFVANCIQSGGTVLKTGRCLAFHERAVRTQCQAYLKELGIDGLIVLGGDGSFRGASTLADEGGPSTIGIPCTIDNDITGTEYCIGFDTARNTALEAIDRIRDTAFSHDRNFMIEVMGRASGALAVDVGIAGGAELIVIPEQPLSATDIIEHMKFRRENRIASIIVVAEADKPGHTLQLAKEIETLCGTHYRVCILGHTQRGGSPTVMDRKTGSLMGVKAVQALQAGVSHQMTAIKDGRITLAPFHGEAAAAFDETALLNLNQLLS